MELIQIAVVDDHPMVAEGISKMLLPYKCIQIIACYANGKALIEGLYLQIPDVLLLDIQLPDTTGNALVRLISQQYPQLRILAITSIDNPFHVKDMLRNGCLGYVLKSIAPSTLAEAIQKVYKGEVFIDPVIQQQLLLNSIPSTKGKPKSIRLTKREREILALVCDGLNNYEIGDKLFLSHRTIENHRLSLYQKFEVKNAAMLIRKALQLDLIR